MSNLPSITSMEIAVVGAGVVVLYVVPFVMAVVGARRQRREQSWQEIMGGFEPTPQTMNAEAPLSVASDRANEVATAPLATVADEAESAPFPAPVSHSPAEPHAAQPEADPPAAEPTVTAPALESTEVAAETDGNGTHGPIFEPFDGEGGYSFRLEDLHRVRLADATGSLVHDAERMLGTQRHTITSTLLVSRYPVRSACLTGVERETAMLRICYLLFPSLWPSSRHEAVAEAVFEIDAATGTVAHRVAVRSAADLDESVRRAIRENGGQV